MENLKGFAYPAVKCEEITIFDQKQPLWDLKRDHGVCRSRPIFVSAL